MVVWINRVGKNYEFEEIFLNNKVIAIDWHEIDEDLSNIKNKEELRNIYIKAYPNENDNQINNQVGQIWSFVKEMKKGDIVLIPLRNNKILIAKIVGDYKFDKERPKHRRDIEIIGYISNDTYSNFTGKEGFYSGTVAKPKDKKGKYLCDFDVINLINIEKIDKILENKKQIILYGVPGVGKTYLAKKFAESQNDVAMYKTVTFHQSFAYEEFIEGLKPKTKNKEIVYEVEDGIFKKMCILAIWGALKNKVNPSKFDGDNKINNNFELNNELNFLINLFKDYLETEKGKELIKEYENTKKEFNEMLNRIKNGEKLDSEYLMSLNLWYLDWWIDDSEADHINNLLRLALIENNDKKLFSSFLEYFESIEPATEFLCKLFPDKFILIDENVVDFAHNFLDIEFEYSEDIDWEKYEGIVVPPMKDRRKKKIDDINLGDWEEYKKVLDKFAEFKNLLEQRFNKKLDYLFIVYFIKNHFFPLMDIFKEKYPPGTLLNTVKGMSFKIKDYLERGIYGSGKIYLERLEKNRQNKIITINIGILRDVWINRHNINKPSDIKTSNGSYIYPILEELKKIEIEYLNKYSSEYQNLTKIRDDVKFNHINNIIDYEQIKQKVINAIKNKELTKEDFQNAPKFILIIDEINRGNISNIFGELITLLEKDKRLTEENEMIVELPYSKELFAVPPNLYIIGTMNTADRSIALLDIALRRRFGFLEIEPNYDLIDKEIEGINLKELLQTINDKITLLKDRDHRIGHSYFLNVKNIEDLKFVWYNEIIPLLMEYVYNDWESLKEILGSFVEEVKTNVKINSDLIDSEEQKIYKIKEFENDEEFIKALKSITISNENNNRESND
ncbi:hypothetical protein JH146_1450 [Methanocaldococcus bathoardescens]|uniref:AAA+ ATPase domain-containing protein n=1 Tax=Methanocaldococcus bathoardescens TaxID=1301915 RepID=A0A076LHA8_9EURY|nr:AAA family ATPase [Methanocaldococcus bathoardescens]AIJ06292.1 hypothetical protein JH146_1450 [Methanocaldococcus bathoardescens]